MSTTLNIIILAQSVMLVVLSVILYRQARISNVHQEMSKCMLLALEGAQEVLKEHDERLRDLIKISDELVKHHNKTWRTG